ncbi:MAG: DUF2165 family protein [Opitutales bacterium]
MLATRLLKIGLLKVTGLFFAIVFFNNAIDDHPSNAAFVQHVLSIDSMKFEGTGERVEWRAITGPTIHTIFYWSIILWELAVAVLSFLGAGILFKNLKASSAVFQRAKSVAVIALGVGMMLWYLAFITVGGEWFYMWASHWNGQDAAWRMFGIMGIILIFLLQKDDELEA